MASVDLEMKISPWIYSTRYLWLPIGWLFPDFVAKYIVKFGVKFV